MAERNSRVFIVATSNDIESLPPELVRKGRLDEIFFVDLPLTPRRATRSSASTSSSAGRTVPASTSARLVAETEGFSGAEIEQAVICAIYECAGAQRAADEAIIAAEIARTRPLSVVMAERVAGLRAWAADRTVKAD